MLLLLVQKLKFICPINLQIFIYKCKEKVLEEDVFLVEFDLFNQILL